MGSSLDIDLWQIALIAAKCLLYVSTALAAGTSIFVLSFGTKVDQASLGLSQIFRYSAILAVVAATSGVFIQVGILADSGLSGAFDWDLFELIWRGSGGSAVKILLTSIGTMAIGFWLKGFASYMFKGFGAVLTSLFFIKAGHASVGSSIALPLLVAIHFTCVAFWMGALIPLRRAATGAVSLAEAASLAHRFGMVALPIVLSLIAAGCVAAWLLLGSIRMVVESTYGLMLLSKTVIVGALLAIAALNKYRLVPQMRRGESAGARALVRTINIELGLALAIFIVTAIFTSTQSPPTMP